MYQLFLNSWKVINYLPLLKNIQFTSKFSLSPSPHSKEKKKKRRNLKKTHQSIKQTVKLHIFNFSKEPKNKTPKRQNPKRHFRVQNQNSLHPKTEKQESKANPSNQKPKRELLLTLRHIRQVYQSQGIKDVRFTTIQK